MKSISKFVIALLISLSIPIASFSQTTYPRIVNDTLILFTSSQLKHTNLIFAEHKMLLEKVDLLESQTRQYKELIKNYERNDTLQESIIVANKEYYTGVIDNLNIQLKKQKRKNFLTNAGWIGGVGAAVLTLILVK